MRSTSDSISVLKRAGMAKQQWDGILILRASLGAWLVVAPWLLPGGQWMHRLSGALAGLVVLAVAFVAERRPAFRFVQAAAALWILFSAAVLPPGPIMISSMMTGLAVLASAAVTRETFAAD